MNVRATTLFLCLLSCSCGAAGSARPHEPRPLPHGESATRSAIDDFGRRLYAALEHGRPDSVLVERAGLDSLLEPEAARELDGQRASTRSPGALGTQERALWASARYAGVCVQKGRVETKGGPVGLRSPGFVFDRALVIGREADGGRIAAWVEGQFLNTDSGFFALRLDRVERARRDHADLELATCELGTRPR